MEVEYGNVTDTDYLRNVLEQLPGVENQVKESQDANKSDAKDDQKDKKDPKKYTKK